MRRAMIGIVATTALFVGACGDDSGGNSELRDGLVDSGEFTEEQADCLADALPEGMTADELDTDSSEETINAFVECIDE